MTALTTTSQPSRAPADHTLLLLDVDGVLVHPVGYKRAVQEMVAHFAAQMGQPDLYPTLDDIAVFEACGVTNEWDSGAICLSAILAAALQAQPDLPRGAFDDTLRALAASGVRVERPAFAALARAVRDEMRNGDIPASVYLRMLGAHASPSDRPLLSALLADVYAIDTPTTRYFQTLTLGSARFADTYQQPAPFESDSYLVTHDVPLLDDAHRARLLDWIAPPTRGAVVYTARPSLPPSGIDPAPDGVSAPEAELAAELLDVAGRVPLLGQGRMAWIAQRRGRSAPSYIKPSPVQALAAIGAAAAANEQAALVAAADLYEDRRLTGPLADLRPQKTHVIICEDSPGGIQAGHDAVDRLRQAGLDVTFTGIGVSPHAEKRAALAEVAAHVVDDVNHALDLVWDGQAGGSA